MTEEMKKIGKRVCVTGASGYIGSWLVKNLLQNGYTVNAILRDPGDDKKTGALLRLPGAEERLRLFRADLCEEGSFDCAVDKCEGVFHLAGPTDCSKHSLEDFVVPAVKGVLNVLEACTRAKSVKRVVFTSSISAASPLNDKGEYSYSCLDESCWTPLDLVKSQPSPSTMYSTAKTLSEKEALKYGIENGLEVVSIGPAIVVGPWLTHMNDFSSAQTILALLGGNDKTLEVLKIMQGILGSFPLVHIDDVCNAHIFLMEQPNVQGRHICSIASLTIPHLTNLLSQRYSHFMTSPKLDDNDSIDHYVPVSSKKLEDIGFSYKYCLENILDENIECALNHGILKRNPSYSSNEATLN